MNKEELKSKLRHKIQNQLGMAMLLIGTSKTEKEKIVNVLKKISALVEIMGQMDKNQKPIEVETEKGTLKIKPIETSLAKLTSLGADWPETKEISDYFGLTTGVAKSSK
jgi:hypothetical protein